jgi:hypothetical protein
MMTTVSWDQLPPEALYHSLNFLDYKELASSSLVNKDWHGLCISAVWSQNKEKVMDLCAQILAHPRFEGSPVFVKGLADLQCTLLGDAKVPSFVASLPPFCRKSHLQLIEKTADGIFALCLQLRTEEDESEASSVDKSCKILCGMSKGSPKFPIQIFSPNAVCWFLHSLRELNRASYEQDVQQRSFMLVDCSQSYINYFRHFTRALKVARSISEASCRDSALKWIILYAESNEEDLSLAEQACKELSTEREIKYCTGVIQDKRAEFAKKQL